MTGDDKTIKILFFGDMAGRPGRFAVKSFLGQNGDNYDFVIANVENASHGFGLTEKNYKELSECGIDCMTSGNHIWDKKDILNYIDTADKLIRPINYPNGTKGSGSKIFELTNGIKIAVINAIGRVFMSPVDSQWEIFQKEIVRLKEITPIVIVDFHAEATAEKVCFGRFCSELGVSAFFGTHTHIQTADEQIMNNMGYITDAGFCGTKESVIGMDYHSSLNRFMTAMPERYEVADGNVVQINAVEVEINSTSGHTAAIKRIFCYIDKSKKEEENER